MKSIALITFVLSVFFIFIKNSSENYLIFIFTCIFLALEKQIEKNKSISTIVFIILCVFLANLMYQIVKLFLL